MRGRNWASGLGSDSPKAGGDEWMARRMLYVLQSVLNHSLRHHFLLQSLVRHANSYSSIWPTVWKTIKYTVNGDFLIIHMGLIHSQICTHNYFSHFAELHKPRCAACDEVCHCYCPYKIKNMFTYNFTVISTVNTAITNSVKNEFCTIIPVIPESQSL